MDITPDTDSSIQAPSTAQTDPQEVFTIRSRSSLRLLYEAEVEIFKKQWGDLESVRTQLGLSQRKMARLLLVDPSAWTRWQRKGEDAPPHIYRMLEWYLLAKGQFPQMMTHYFETRSGAQKLEIDQQRVERAVAEVIPPFQKPAFEKIEGLGFQLADLKKHIASQNHRFALIGVLLLAIGIILGFLMARIPV